MITINVRNVNHALHEGITLIRDRGVQESSRNGPVFRVPEPVTTVYRRPMERVLFAPWRDANPFFSLVESMWMLAGRDTLADLTPYVKRMSEFSDDGGETQPGAYGRRWRDHTLPDDNMGAASWGDQLDWVVKRLRENPSDRRAVIQMWDPGVDMDRADFGSKDVPCNLTALPWVSDGALHLTVFCRSNDMILGAYGANAVHFSVLLEYLAGRLGLPVGTYTQISNNFHAYEVDILRVPEVPIGRLQDPYDLGLVEPLSMYKDWGKDDGFSPYKQQLRVDLSRFFDEGDSGNARWPFLRDVAGPMADAHATWKAGGPKKALRTVQLLASVQASDWRRAAIEWIQRRTKEEVT